MRSFPPNGLESPRDSISGAGDLVRERELQPIAPVPADPLAVALTRFMRAECHVGGCVHGDHEGEVPDLIIAQTAARDVALGPYLPGRRARGRDQSEDQGQRHNARIPDGEHVFTFLAVLGLRLAQPMDRVQDREFCIYDLY